jgi:hypothetical protein
MREPNGPFRPEHVREGDRYEISRGHPIHVAPAGARHGNKHMVGAIPLATDPAEPEVGIDVGYALDEMTLRAPDISVGNVPDKPGWAKGAPTLAVEYADRGTDEDDLQVKIQELLGAGTEQVWVVRLVGPRRVDVHAKGAPPRTVDGEGHLEAPGLLARQVPVAALFDADRANEAAMANLLAKEGYASIEGVRASGRAQGREEGREEGRMLGLRSAIEMTCSLFSITLDDERRARISSADERSLEELFKSLTLHRAWP